MNTGTIKFQLFRMLLGEPHMPYIIAMPRLPPQCDKIEGVNNETEKSKRLD